MCLTFDRFNGAAAFKLRIHYATLPEKHGDAIGFNGAAAFKLRIPDTLWAAYVLPLSASMVPQRLSCGFSYAEAAKLLEDWAASMVPQRLSCGFRCPLGEVPHFFEASMVPQRLSCGFLMS